MLKVQFQISTVDHTYFKLSIYHPIHQAVAKTKQANA